jgi:hypothetical protein
MRWISARSGGAHHRHGVGVSGEWTVKVLKHWDGVRDEIKEQNKYKT